MVPYAAGVYKGLGSLFGTIFPNVSKIFFGMSANTVCMIIVAVLTAIYLLWGGYKATATVDFVQGIIMIVGVIVMAIAIVNNPNVGGIANAVKTLKNNQFNPTLVSIFGGSNWKFLLTNILLTSFGTWALPQMVHKFYAINGESSIRKGMIVSTGFALIIGCGAYFVGTFGRFFVAATETGAPALDGGYDGIVPAMLTGAFGGSVWGNVLLSVILLLVLSASMSTLSSLVLSSSSSISVDMLETFRKKVDTKKQVLFMRVLCLLFIFLSVLFASFNFTIIVSIMSYSWGMVSGCFIGPYVWGLYSKKITRAGAWAGMIGGFITIVSMTLYNTLSSPAMTDGLYAAFKAASANSPLYGVCAMAVSAAIVPIVSLFTRKFSGEHLEYVFSTTKEEEASA